MAGWLMMELPQTEDLSLSPQLSPTHLVVFGRPGSGKTSLAEQLGEDEGYVLIRTGEMLRAAVRRRDSLGARVEQYVTSGKLVPDDVIFELLEQSLKEPGTARLLFDGFPRTLGQVTLLEQFEQKLNFTIDGFLEIAISRAEAIARMIGRRVCPVCGTPYHIVRKPPKIAETCDHDGARLVSRPDDALDVVEVRQTFYDEHAAPVVEHYRVHAPDRFFRVNGEQSFDAVYAETRRVLGFS
ncbi:MAG TPA: nucleoside monophosphate kinase [Isosphaeraceae bacterium]|nr:nucleoside monophosphate kinase [Isosphaeraceae bacterium]